MRKALVVLGVVLAAAACRDVPVTSPAAERAVIATQREHLELPAVDNGDGTSTVVFQPGPGYNNGGDEGTLSRGKDTFIEHVGTSDVGDRSFYAWLSHYNSDCEPGHHSLSLYQFDVEDLPDPSMVTSARLALYHRLFRLTSGWWPTPTTSFSLSTVRSEWSETAVRWSTQPTLGAEVAAVTVPTDTRTPNFPPKPGFATFFEGWVTFDVTSLYAAWKDGSVPNYGVAYRRTTQFCENGDVSTVTEIASSDQRDAFVREFRPKLVVTYRTNHPPTVTMDALAVALVGSPTTFVANAADEDGDTLTYFWTVDGITAGPTPTITRVFADPGPHVVSVTVSDGRGGTASANQDIFVLTPAQWVDRMRGEMNAAALEKGLANSMAAKLDAAWFSFMGGKMTAARGQMGAFRNEVEAALTTGRLPASLANQLLLMANQLLAALD